jgi:hypothetical protein
MSQLDQLKSGKTPVYLVAVAVVLGILIRNNNLEILRMSQRHYG